MLGAGITLGPYDILSPLGAGGFGEVYKARDTRLDRTVAIKILPSADLELKARFEREAKAIAALTHPHICTLYDVGHQDGTDYLVMEYLEGETLDKKIARGPIKIDEAVKITVEIAEALDKAHRAGIVHRDLKPANVMLTKGGVKLLDFGLAKLRAGPAISGFSAATMTTPPITGHGSILGTLQYMAPEQVEGQDADARTDLFAFGAVLYEMITGRKAFEGKSQASVIAGILERQPTPISSLEPLAPPLLDHLVARCLAKDPDDRWQSASDLRSELAWIGGAIPSETAAASARFTPRRMAALVSIIMLAAVIGVGVGVTVRGGPATTPVVRFELRPETGSIFTSTPILGSGVQAALSPDGRYLAFIASTEGIPQLWVRALDAVSATALRDTAGASFPFWSPDSRTIGYFARGMLQRIDLAGTGAQTLAAAPSARGGTWSTEGVILFCPTSGSGLMRVPAGGGKVEPATSLAAGHHQQVSAEYWPVFLPDGRHFLSFALAARKEHRGIYIGALGSPDTKQLGNTETMASFADGHLLFVRQGTLVAQPFDVNRLELTGVATPLAEHIGYYPNFGYAAFSVSQAGLLTYAPAMATTGQLTWFDRSGRREASVGAPASYSAPSLSPDGSRAVVSIIDPQTATSHLWLFDLIRNTNSRLTLGPDSEFLPVWSPDGRALAFSSDRTGLPDLYQKPSVGMGQETRILSTNVSRFPTDWSRDGRALVYQEATTRGYDILLLSLADRSPIPFLQSPFNEAQGRLSPDGRWMAYISDESARLEVYVQPFPPTGTKWQISTDGGAQPAWRGDGKELFYVAAAGKMMAVSVNPTARDFDAGVPRPLFEVTTPEVSAPYFWHYAVTSDGRRFLVNAVNRTSSSIPLTVLLNWEAALKK